MKEKVQLMVEEAIILADAATSLDVLETIRITFMGKKGRMTEILKSVATLSPEERPLVGQIVNDAKVAIQSAIEARSAELKTIALNHRLASERLDITLPGRGLSQGHLHPITLTMQKIETYFAQMGFDRVNSQEIETEYYNFDALNTPSHHPARAMHDTFYFEEGSLLRTHTSSGQIRYLETHTPPLRMLSMGRVYRCDSDLTHTPMFHQAEGLWVDEHCNFSQLKGLLQDFMQFFFDEALAIRFRPSYFPFTEPSAEADITCVICKGSGCRVCKQSGWLEVLGCGMVHPTVLAGKGIDTEKYRGFAFGMGIDRLAMLRYQINDLRLFFENDLRFLEQF